MKWVEHTYWKLDPIRTEGKQWISIVSNWTPIRWKLIRCTLHISNLNWNFFCLFARFVWSGRFIYIVIFLALSTSIDVDALYFDQKIFEFKSVYFLWINSCLFCITILVETWLFAYISVHNWLPILWWCSNYEKIERINQNGNNIQKECFFCIYFLLLHKTDDETSEGDDNGMSQNPKLVEKK